MPVLITAKIAPFVFIKFENVLSEHNSVDNAFKVFLSSAVGRLAGSHLLGARVP